MATPITVRVRVLRTFDGAATERGTHVKPYNEGDVLDVPAALAAMFAENGDVELVDDDEPLTDDTAAPAASDDELSLDDRRAWITSGGTTGKAVVEWLRSVGADVPSGLRVPDIKGLALDVVDRLEAQAS